MPTLPSSTPDEPSERPPVFGLFSLNWTVPDSTSPSRHRALHRVQIGLDLSEVDLRATRTWFRRNAADPVATAVRRWCWGNAAQTAIAGAIAEAWRDGSNDGGDMPGTGTTGLTAQVLRERFSLATLTARERPMDPLTMDAGGAVLGEVQVDLPASILLEVGRPADTVFYDPAFGQAMERAAEAVREELTDALTQQLDRSCVVFSQHHNDPADVGALQRLMARWQDTGTGPIVVDDLGTTNLLDRDAEAVRDAAQEAFGTVSPAPPGRTPTVRH